MKFILGKKEGMTQVFDGEGQVWPATVFTVSPATITQLKTVKRDGYDALQLGFGEHRVKHVAKSQQGHFKKVGDTLFRHLREAQVDEGSEAKVGDQFGVGDMFAEGDMVTVSGVSKGKGFQGVVKRHGFHGGPRSHGQKHTERAPGSIGGGMARVIRGRRMPGRMGADRVTVKNLIVLQIDKDNDRLLISGAVPGRRGTMVEIAGK
ncbi:MAG: 50S ribosomal protein L3 [Patescibacteria group bacterium]|nr:50S ribosomal protein L3 [Patescibacteria group bacterium]